MRTMVEDLNGLLLALNQDIRKGLSFEEIPGVRGVVINAWRGLDQVSIYPGSSVMFHYNHQSVVADIKCVPSPMADLLLEIWLMVGLSEKRAAGMYDVVRKTL